MSSDNHIRLAAFDLDGTLLCGDTVCQAIARQMGHLERMNEIEQLQDLTLIAAAREELAGYYRSVTRGRLRSFLEDCTFAPGAREGLSLLRAHGIAVAIVSITWSFAVDHFAGSLGADYSVGTVLSDNGTIEHFWSHDKPVWLMNLMHKLDLDPSQVAAVGDSPGDVGMLEIAAHSFYVGREMPEGCHAVHRPDGDILAIATEIAAAGLSETP